MLGGSRAIRTASNPARTRTSTRSQPSIGRWRARTTASSTAPTNGGPSAFWPLETAGSPYRYVARSADGIGGYLLYTHEPAGANLPYGFELDCRDFLWSDPSAASAMLDFVRGHAGMGHGLRWVGPPSDPLEQLLSGLGPSIEKRLVAMCRIVNIAAALEARGYADGVTATITIEVTDDVLSGNAGEWTVEVVDGAASVSRGGGANVTARMDVRTLAPLFTGALDPGAAAAVGRLEADAPAIETLRVLFSGPAPWMAEFY